MRRHLEVALHQLSDLPLDKAGQPLRPDDGVVGYWRLADSFELAVAAVSKAVEGLEKSKVLTCPAFEDLLDGKDKKPGSAPHPDDLKFDPPGISYDTPEERQIAKRYRYQKALNVHGKKVRAYEARVEQADDLKRQFGDGQARYLAYARAAFSDGGSDPVGDFLNEERPLPIPEAAARYGSFIVGNHGSGKSEVIKQRVWHYLTKADPQETIIVIDPHGEMGPEIARMKPNLTSGRLVYLDPTLDPEFMPCPDLLNTSDKSADNLYFEAEHYGSALRMMAGNMDPTGTGNMENLCRNCAHVVLEHDRFNLEDLLDLLAMEAPKKGQPVEDPPAIYEAAIAASVNSRMQRRFAEQFLSSSYAMSRAALHGRLDRILGSPLVQRMLLNPPSFNLVQLVEQRKVIVINLPFKQLTEPVTAMIGQLMMAQIVLAILKRDENRLDEYPPVHVFIDEAQHLVSFETAKQINELRKFGFSLSLATQYVDQFPTSILEAVKGLGLQIAGFCEGRNLEAMNAIFDHRGAEATTRLKDQKVGQFTLKSRSAPGSPAIAAQQFTTPTSLLWKGEEWRQANSDNFMSDEEWQSVKADQIKRYYRQVAGEDEQGQIDLSPAQPANKQEVAGRNPISSKDEAKEDRPGLSVATPAKKKSSHFSLPPLKPDLGYGSD